jgi:MFS transporter
VVAGNLTAAAGFAGYLAVAQSWQLVAFAFLTGAGSRLFWTANLALLADATSPQERPRWVAFQRAARNAGFAAGGLLGAAAASLDGTTGLHLLAASQAASSLLAGLLVLSWRAASRSERPAPARRPDGTAAQAALTGQRLLLVAGTNIAFVLCVVTLDVLIPVYLVRDLGLGAWLAGVVFTVNTILVTGAQTLVSRVAEPWPPVQALQAAAACYAGCFMVLLALDAAPLVTLIPGRHPRGRCLYLGRDAPGSGHERTARRHRACGTAGPVPGGLPGILGYEPGRRTWPADLAAELGPGVAVAGADGAVRGHRHSPGPARRQPARRTGPGPARPRGRQ